MTSGQQLLSTDAVTAEDHMFIEALERCELPAEEWTHLAHVRVAWVALMLDPRP